MRTDRRLAATACIFLGTAFCAAAGADPVIYSDRAEFTAALPQSPSVLDFDQMAAGTTIADAATAGGITFSYDFEGLAMKVAHLYATTSAPNFLGTGDGGMFHDGDDFTLSFAPGSAIGLFFISADPLVSGDIKITAGGATAALDASRVQDTLPDGSRVYFLGVVDTSAPITQARVEALAGGFFLYNVDDIMTAPLGAPSMAINEPVGAESF
ncbi:MAG: hypothetical protein ACR2QV_13995 [Gammaproteobacteria bacterium]